MNRNKSIKETIIEDLINTNWSNSEKSRFFISRVSDDSNKYLFGKNIHNEGFYLVWNDNSVVDLTREVYQDIIKEGKKSNLAIKYHIFSTGTLIDRKNIKFYKISSYVK
ncbi:hypothetical protein CQ29_23235 [Salmonella enterica subsp. enterica serovar Enteritidis]|nr:hypothetical protein [Salmonella enterica subsp. enterica serovar Enteritidis]